MRVTIDDEAFGYLKRVIVTPAVDSCITYSYGEHKSTEQKSQTVHIVYD